jgi:hypothetical protein
MNNLPICKCKNASIVFLKKKMVMANKNKKQKSQKEKP